jgi:hypothetical protein
MISYDQHQAEILRRRRERWAKIVAGEPGGRPPGRRPRDPDQELLLLRMDRARLARREAAGELVTRRKPTELHGDDAVGDDPSARRS